MKAPGLKYGPLRDAPRIDGPEPWRGGERAVFFAIGADGLVMSPLDLPDGARARRGDVESMPFFVDTPRAELFGTKIVDVVQGVASKRPAMNMNETRCSLSHSRVTRPDATETAMPEHAFV